MTRALVLTALVGCAACAPEGRPLLPDEVRAEVGSCERHPGTPILVRNRAGRVVRVDCRVHEFESPTAPESTP